MGVSEWFENLKLILNVMSGKKNRLLVLFLGKMQKRKLCWRIFYRTNWREEKVATRKKLKERKARRHKQKKWGNGAVKQYLKHWSRYVKWKEKTRKSSSNFGELLESSSKLHQDLLVIRKKNWNWVKKSLTSSEKGSRKWW